MKKRTRKALIFTVKLVVAAALLAFVAHKIEWNDYVRVVEGNQVLCRGLRSTITSANGYFLAAAFVLFVIPMLMLAVRWWYLLRILDIRLSFREAVRLTFLGTFFNFVIPGMVSGDVVKAYYVFKHTDRKAAALLSVFVDRVVGLLEFAVLPALVMAYMYAAGANTDRLLLPAVVVAVVLAGVVLSLAVLLSRPLRRALRLNRILSRLPWQPHLAVAAEAAELYRRRLTGLLKAMGITFVGQTVFLAG
ncbi:MAG: hypothetical protein AMJ81_07095, partial [Phycisphaerae bacterium SM23_33]